MRPAYITPEFLRNFIASALAEDVGDGDHSTLASVSPQARQTAHLLIKDEGILAGVDLATEIFRYVDESLEVNVLINDGSAIKKGDIAFTVSGLAQPILTVERLVLNCMQRMSAIATRTSRYNALIAGTGAQLLDTRKTTPNFRLLEKWAVFIGGGGNHRLGLFDMIMLKDNHIDVAGGISAAINRTKEYLRATGKNMPVEVETRTLAEVEEVLNSGGADIIMLDNMDTETMRKAVQRIAGRCKTEASGGIDESTIRAIAQCGVDYISVGELTHTVVSLDMSLKTG